MEVFQLDNIAVPALDSRRAKPSQSTVDDTKIEITLRQVQRLI